MADFTFSMPDGEETADTLIKLYKTLSVMFSNLDSKTLRSLRQGKQKFPRVTDFAKFRERRF